MLLSDELLVLSYNICELQRQTASLTSAKRSLPTAATWCRARSMATTSRSSPTDRQALRSRICRCSCQRSKQHGEALPLTKPLASMKPTYDAAQRCAASLGPCSDFLSNQHIPSSSSAAGSCTYTSLDASAWTHINIV